MVEIFTNEMLKKIRRTIKIEKISIVCAVIVCIVLCAVCAVFLNDGNVFFIRVAGCVLLVLCGWYVTGCIIAGILPQKDCAEHMERMLSDNRVEIDGKFIGCGRTLTVKRSVVATEIQFENLQQIIYWDNAFGECPFENGCIVRMSVCDGFICSFETLPAEEEDGNE